MIRSEDGVWTAQLPSVEAGVWEYSFIVDGLTMIDPSNPALKPQRNPGSSILHLPGTPPKAWDFKDVLPAVNKLAHQEVDIVNLVRKVADYKVMEWDFKSGHSHDSRPAQTRLSPEEMESLTFQLRNFIQFAVVNLIDEPGHAMVKVREIAPNVLRFRLVLVKKDVSMLIGTGGHTAAAIRNIIKSAAAKQGVSVLLQILSHEEEIALEQESSERD